MPELPSNVLLELVLHSLLVMVSGDNLQKLLSLKPPDRAPPEDIPFMFPPAMTRYSPQEPYVRLVVCLVDVLVLIVPELWTELFSTWSDGFLAMVRQEALEIFQFESSLLEGFIPVSYTHLTLPTTIGV